eukprot:Lankesteria_metandrocarpae@DN9294_c0_g1_i1.p1
MLTNYLMEMLEDCADNRIPFGNPAKLKFCEVARPIYHCFRFVVYFVTRMVLHGYLTRKIAANYYFTSEPKSTGYVKLATDGKLIVNANYLTDEQDQKDAIRGLTKIFEITNSTLYDGIFEEPG